jgi:hypothetical protein
MVQGLSDAELTLLREQMDRTAIREQLERHYHGLDSRDFEGVFLKAYSDDCVMTSSNGREVTRGYDENLDRLRRFEVFPSSVHVMGNVSVTLDGDEATSETYIVAFLESKDEPRRILARAIHYSHKWRRYADGWRSYEMAHAPFWQFDAECVENTFLGLRPIGQAPAANGASS